MKIHYVRLRHFRGVSEARVDFAESGVTVVEGANEQGKSSLVEAIDLLLDEPDTSAKRAVKAVQPTHVDAGAEVEAEFSTGNYRFVYRKRIWSSVTRGSSRPTPTFVSSAVWTRCTPHVAR